MESKKVFRRWSFGTAAIFGYYFADYVTEKRHLNNAWHTRPDYKPYPAMVKKEGLEKVQEDYMMEKLYPWRQKSEYKKSPIFRFFFPELADWEIKSNPYSQMKRTDVFTVEDGHYKSYTNDFKEHLPH